MEPINMETYQLVNMNFLRFELAIFCRDVCKPKDSAGCLGCRINKVKNYLNDPGMQASEVKG
jgi:hypothetical protein